jgi:glyoxylate/hydroxypyruvate reductase
VRIAYCSTHGKAQPWVDAIRLALPEAEVWDWRAGDGRAADYGIVWSPPQQFVDEQPQLKAIFNLGAGVDALMKLRISPGVAVVRLDDAGMSVQMAEFVCHAVIRHFRELDVYVKEVAQGQWSFHRPLERAEFPVGVMGLGVLGERVARALLQFEYPVLGWSRSPKAIEGVRAFSGQDGFNDFLAATRILVCLLPLTPQTEGIMNRDTLSRLKPGGYVINVARGAHLVDEDLIALLDSGHLAGATLDVFRQEPLPAVHAFWKHPKITVTPHTSARTLREETIAQIAAKMRALHSGRPLASLAGVVDPQRGY